MKYIYTMSAQEHFRKLEKMYLSAPCNEYYSPAMLICEGAAELSIRVKEEFFHSGGATHGSVYFKALDDAAFFAASSLVQDFQLLTVNFTVYMTAPISSGIMKATGRVIQNAGRLLIAEAVLVNSEDAEIGRGSGVFVKSRTRLSEAAGYGP